MIIHAVWAIAMVSLIFWWGTLIYNQSGEIARLEAQLGVAPSVIDSRQDRTEFMVLSEASFFILVVMITNGILLALFLRDQKRAKSIQNFFASMTHELRTPLTSIRLQAETLRDIEDNPKHAPFVSRLLEDVERLEGQVQQSLELARTEGGGELQPTSIEIYHYFTHKIQPMLDRAGARMIVSAHIPPARITADPTALTMVFRNTIDNALRYYKKLPAQIEINGSIEGSDYRLTIHKTNSEFTGDPSALGRLFYRGSQSQGAGVGLFLIQSLMQKMGGSGRFETKTGFKTHLDFKRDDQS
jgi:signal transduction histidine kinase